VRPEFIRYDYLVRANRIDTCFEKLVQKGKKGLITYVTAGDPDLITTGKLVLTLECAGADIVELGVPFSDPMADGPVIQRASQRSLAAGTSLTKILDLVGDLRQRTSIPLVLMTYYNPVLNYGLPAFADRAAESGVDGLIVPDLPVEESAALRQEMNRHNLALIPLVAPTSTEERLTANGSVGRGFVYCVSLNGVTGARNGLPPHIEEFMQRVRSCCHQPLAIGFGISQPWQAHQLSILGDAVIVGSAIVSVVEHYADDRQLMLEEVSSLVKQLRSGLLYNRVSSNFYGNQTE
jgi:tryptophan synthase alpha chain